MAIGRLGGLCRSGAAAAGAFSAASRAIADAAAQDLSGCRTMLGLRAAGAAGALEEAEIRSAYRAAARQLHPDRGGERGQFQEMQRCYEALLAEARAGNRDPEWLRQMQKDFAHYSCC